jgi:hypothetical protein
MAFDPASQCNRSLSLPTHFSVILGWGPKQTTTPSSLGPTRRTVSRVHLSLAGSKGGGDEGDADGELDVQQVAAFPTKRRPLDRSQQPNFVA